MESSRRSGDRAARAALRSRMAHPTSLRLDEVQPNPLNPRYDEDDVEVLELAETLTRVGQLQPVLVVPREQYLQAYPDQHGNLGGEAWVVIVGNRRLTASRIAGRPALDVRVAADLDTAQDLEDRILIENIQRKDLPPLLEAEHLQRRLNRPGQTTRSVGAAIGKSHAYFQQRVDLLKMIPEFRELFRSGEINLKIGRRLGSLDESERRSRLAAGPPYTPIDSAVNSHAARILSGNPVCTESAGTGDVVRETVTALAIPRQSQPVGSPAIDNQVSVDPSLHQGQPPATGDQDIASDLSISSDDQQLIEASGPRFDHGTRSEPQPVCNETGNGAGVGVPMFGQCARRARQRLAEGRRGSTESCFGGDTESHLGRP